ncbi:MAG: cbb3-type cytochrome c oxidase N-terminal domain-containing protein [Bacteroidota bacterium]
MKYYFPAWLRIPVFFLLIVLLVEYVVESGDQPAFMEQPVVLGFLILVFVIIVAIEAIVGALSNVLYQTLTEEQKLAHNARLAEGSKFMKWVKQTYLKLLGSKPVEEEHEIILDHNYDGIKELDNDLPPWWLYGFYACVIFGVVYMVNFHILGGDNQYEELEINLAQAQIELEEYKRTAKDLVDVNTVEILTDAADIKAGRTIYELNCVACHKVDGGGGIGPNLTDKHWILGGGIKNVFKTISEGGRAGKGMIAWKQNLKPSEMAQVASYVLTLEGTTPAEPKEPQGDIWVDENAPVEEVPTEDLEVETGEVIQVEEVKRP